MKVLFLVPYPSEGASNRIRVEQFIPYLESKGVICRMRPFVNKNFFGILYRPGCYLEKMLWFLVCTIYRIFDVMRAFNYDLVFIHREAYPLGGAFFESILHGMKKPIVFDFDDAIFLPNTSEHNIYIDRFKNPRKIAKIIKMSAQVMAGNSYLGRYALSYNSNVTVIPSSVDVEKYHPPERREERKQLVIGWIGSYTTSKFLYEFEDVFVELSKRYRNIVFKVVGPSFYSHRLKNIVNKPWSLEDEAADLQTFDIGIMPMSDNEWTRGKCGFKALLYMAHAIPVIASPVGVNTTIIKDGVTGYLATDHKDWVEKLSLLIEDGNLRKEIGARGRETVMHRYSLQSSAPLFYNTLIKAAQTR